MPMEWINARVDSEDAVNVIPPGQGGTPATQTTVRVELELDRDEVADIYLVRSTLWAIQPITIAITSESVNTFALGLSVDPKSTANLVDTTGEPHVDIQDREIFYLHYWALRSESVNQATDVDVNMVTPATDHLEAKFDPPLTVGGDLGMLVQQEPDDNGAIIYLATIYFKRRKAGNEKANLIMLRR